MMTKKQFATMVVNDFCRENEVSFEDAHNYIAESSRLAVALEYLGLLTEEEEGYSLSRAGLSFTSVDENRAIFLTTREILFMLPETINM